MASEEVINYVVAQKKEGFELEQIRDVLLEEGWPEEEVDDSIVEAEKILQERDSYEKYTLPIISGFFILMGTIFTFRSTFLFISTNTFPLSKVTVSLWSYTGALLGQLFGLAPLPVYNVALGTVFFLFGLFQITSGVFILQKSMAGWVMGKVAAILIGLLQIFNFYTVFETNPPNVVFRIIYASIMLVISISTFYYLRKKLLT